MSFISMKNIVKCYGNRDNLTYALNNVSLHINHGEMLAVMGPSGSGKSTLLNIMGCLDIPSEGTYLLDDVNIETMSKKKLAEIRNKKIGFVFQNFSLLDKYTVLENVELPLLYRKTFLKKSEDRLSSKTIREQALHFLDSVGLKNHAKKYPTQLSGGQQQRVAIARSLVGDPDLILADEPTGALDQKTGLDIMELLKSIHSNQKTIIIITHDPKVATHCEKILNMEDGKLLS